MSLLLFEMKFVCLF